MRGRKPRPTEALRLAGSECVKFRVNEPTFTGTPRKPEWLSEYAAEVWDRVVPDLIEQGITKRIDQDSIAAYCEACGNNRRATEQIAREGLTFISAKGEVKKHPAATAQKEAMALIARFAAEFGMTGASRSKVKSQGKAEEGGKSRFFGGGEKTA